MRDLKAAVLVTVVSREGEERFTSLAISAARLTSVPVALTIRNPRKPYCRDLRIGSTPPSHPVRAMQISASKSARMDSMSNDNRSFMHPCAPDPSRIYFVLS
ncbi:hypothetical protein BDV26DRAFT_96292 [Aspergillus bertholletiae]|uniref:Uncharacterized protein n=1 Tax=Aspergillus bertholletiae TaxID=1226010 RepID=A0A5N7BHV0_9EURO|nr:hypothetical protein BDV26DRAFT_96292 [Aspergillus bertholletiae]